MSVIHYFPRYSQAENFVTNNTILLLLRLREFDRLKFEKLMEELCAEVDEEAALSGSWLHFRQQVKTGKSVVDGFIAQDSIKIAIETKLGGTFDLKQIENHLAVFANEQHKFLILLNPTQGELPQERLESIRQLAATRAAQILPLTFQDIIEKARGRYGQYEEVLALIEDYEAFCSEMSLLPRDQVTLFVPPCGQSYEDNIQFRLYYCSATWSRRRAKYIGIYKDRKISAIGRIAKIVVCDIDMVTNKTVKNSESITPEETERILGAAVNARKRNWDLTVGNKFYLLDALEATEFRKSSPRGIMGHRYLDLEEILNRRPPDDLAELAAILREYTWE
ncbi:MAG: hypothetical protein AB1772_13100 [Candidatus Zixiibacteriota bacterium]